MPGALRATPAAPKDLPVGMESSLVTDLQEVRVGLLGFEVTVFSFLTLS